MSFFGHDWTFWVALLVAAAIRVVTSPFHSIWRAIIMVVTSVFVAWAFTDAAVDMLHLNPVVYKTPVGALLALTADGLVRLVFAWLQEPAKVIDLWNRFRKGGPE